MSATALHHVDIPRVIEPDVSKPARKQVLHAIRDEIRSNGGECSWKQAKGLLEMLVQAAQKVRRGHAVYHLSPEDISCRHDLLVAVMPDDRIAAPDGSAHAAINRYICRSNELALVHVNRSHGGQMYCAIMIEMRRV